MLRRLIFLTLMASLPAVWPGVAAACTRDEPYTERTVFDEAVEVFRAHVTRVELVKSPAGGRNLVHVYYKLVEAVKGKPSPTGPITTWTSYFGGCGVQVTVGLDYLFFVKPFKDPEEWTKEARGPSSGWISIFATKTLDRHEPYAEKDMARVRRYKR